MRRMQVSGHPALFWLLAHQGFLRLPSLMRGVRLPAVRPRMPETSAGLLSAMHEAAPPGQPRLSWRAKQRLRGLTTALLRLEQTGAASTWNEFCAVRGRGLAIDRDRLRAALSGKVIVVTGGTGCIGSTLLEHLQELSPAALISVSRGVSPKHCKVPGVVYMHADVRDEAAMRRLFRSFGPDVVYHLAAQRSPRLAEVEVEYTLTTNVLGTRSVVRAAEDASVPLLVYSSTGKALRPFTSDVYAASKKAGEWLVATAAERGRLRASAARFTHVVDNSLIEQRLRSWIRKGGPIRLHGSDVAFFVQSARESAQLLLDATLGARDGELRLHAIRDLGWPVNLLELSLGAMDAARTVVPLYFCGFEQGYEEKPYAGLYDPQTSGCVSPLVSALENPTVAPSPTCPGVDVFTLPAASEDELAESFAKLERACTAPADTARRRALEDFSWALLDANLDRVPRRTLERLSGWLSRLSEPMSEEHRRITEALHRAAGVRIAA